VVVTFTGVPAFTLGQLQPCRYDGQTSLSVDGGNAASALKEAGAALFERLQTAFAGAGKEWTGAEQRIVAFGPRCGELDYSPCVVRDTSGPFR
jgi:hypothetical protein